MLMVEHNLSVVADLSDTITVLTRGRVLAEGDYADGVGEPGGDRSLSRGPAMPEARVPEACAACTPGTAKSTSCTASNFDVAQARW